MTRDVRNDEITVPDVARSTSRAGRHKLAFQRVFNAPRELVFRAWTEPEHVSKWWDPTGAPLRTCEIDLRPGGAFRWVHRDGHEFAGTYRLVVAPELIVLGVRLWPDRPEIIGTQAFAEVSGRTQFDMTIECASRDDLDALREMRVDVGTSQTLQNLSQYLSALLKA
jgi:uncharacterized protein YndB with AHSA1/START domain